jgi:hypothetical protein
MIIGAEIVRRSVRNSRLGLVRDSSAYRPKSVGNGDRINSTSLPPFNFVGNSMVLAVMHPAQRNREFVAVLASQRACLSKTQVVGIGRGAPANQTRLQGDEPQVCFVPTTADLRKVEHALVDLDGVRCVQVTIRGVDSVLCGAQVRSVGTIHFRFRAAPRHLVGPSFARMSLRAHCLELIRRRQG